MRPAQDGPSAHSATPIYDALYSEYLRSFRTLPGDRSGEEDLVFKGFGGGGTGTYHGRGGSGGSYAGVGHGLGHSLNQPGQHSGYPGQWQPVSVRPHTGHFPAALPPAPRRGL
ncbi:hypothetical protein [Streptomyces sp. SP18CS02]|uniref:hypothetical protein n=1 Tax=Streptomyces sp. SP18CS02 TaxID=3002531 RepID=UPI003FCC9AE4